MRRLQGEICDIDGKCVDAAEDELFKLTTREGKIAVEREVSWQPHPSGRLVEAGGRVQS